MRMDILQGLKGSSAHRSNGQKKEIFRCFSRVLLAECDAVFSLLGIRFSIQFGWKHILDHSDLLSLCTGIGVIEDFAIKFGIRLVLTSLLPFIPCIFAEVLTLIGVQDGIDSIKSLSTMCFLKQF